MPDFKKFYLNEMPYYLAFDNGKYDFFFETGDIENLEKFVKFVNTGEYDGSINHSSHNTPNYTSDIERLSKLRVDIKDYDNYGFLQTVGWLVSNDKEKNDRILELLNAINDDVVKNEMLEVAERLINAKNAELNN